tara:strand:- start:74 stop:640 length:567 start_codon:yes stop_codon:yes gene_type:complete
MSTKGKELKLFQREHFENKIRNKLSPEIEREELMLKTTIQAMLEKGTKAFAKSIGADKVIERLKKAEDEMTKSSRQAFVFFGNSAKKEVHYSKSLKDAFTDRDERDNVEVKDCEGQLRDWAEAQASRSAEKTPQGKRLAYLKALKESANDMVKEASVSDDLKASLDNLFQLVGVSWQTKLPALPPPRK